MTTLKKRLFLLSLFIAITSFSQQREISEFGEPSMQDFAMESYAKDPEAAGVVLFESGNVYFDLVDNQVKLIQEVYVKMKVLDASKFDRATVEIPYYSEKNNDDNFKKITAITHNGATKTYVAESSIFDTDQNPYWSIKKFAFPNVKDGSILEYTYTIESDHLNFGGWRFQGTLPVVYSEFHTELPGNFKYNRTLYGNRKLYINKAEKTTACFSIEGFDVQAECEIATYAMKNVPAAKEEKYMLSINNYLPGIKYELIQYVDFDRSKHHFTDSWDEVDDFYHYDKDVGRQLKYTNYFKDALPESVFSEPSDLEKAKAVYYYIQTQMAWNGKYRILRDVRVKDAFEQKSGNSSEINFALINALQAAGLDPKIMLISTRDFAQPTMQYPVITDFVYALAYLKIGNQKYLLDATDKYTSFGVLPFRDLSVQGRVLDFKKGSYWEPIVPISKNMHYVNMKLEADESGIFKGKINEVSTGYIAVGKRKKYNDYNKDDLLKIKQSKNETFDISEYKIENEKDLEQPFKESFNIVLHEQPVSDKLFLNPFLMQTYFTKNPFTKETREYPIDFGFPVANNYLISIDLKDQYEAVKVPENKILKLPDDDGEISVVYTVAGNKVNIRLSVKLNNYSFPKEAYPAIRQFFTTLSKIENDETIELKKV